MPIEKNSLPNDGNCGWVLCIILNNCLQYGQKFLYLFLLFRGKIVFLNDFEY